MTVARNPSEREEANPSAPARGNLKISKEAEKAEKTRKKASM